jgi:site-specific DNA-methyltransferase (adenine-specific)
MPKKKTAKPEVTPPPAAEPQQPHKGRPSALVDTSVIYCGDNLQQLRKLPDACIDLIYIDPPFNSNRNYEVFWGETKEKRAFEDRHASTAAYIEFMRPRCLELARVLKKTGSFYYHCDWHASHYVKVMLDQIFGENVFQNEIVWKRTSAHSSANRYGPVHDVIFFYTGSEEYTWNPQYQPYEKEYVDTFFDQEDADGHRYKRMDLTGDGVRHGETGQVWRGLDVTAKGRHWAYPPSKLDEFDKQGRIHWPKKEGGMPRLKQYVEDLPGIPLQTVWTDISPLHNLAAERLGYPTQKPLALLERIIKASSNPNDIILDAFCGCGTALVAAENLSRQWIGIDISPTACRVMAKRLHDVCHVREDEKLWRAGRGFVVRDLPWSEDQLRRLPPFEFENWAVIALGGVPNKTQVGDHGIDGRIYPISSLPRTSGEAVGELAFMDVWYPIQVKQKDKVGRPDIDSFEAALQREKRTTGFFVAFDYSSDAMTEIGAFFKRTGIMIRALTVKDIMDEQIARKLA